MEALISIPENVEVKTVKAVLRALGVSFKEKVGNGTAKKNKEKPYNPEYVAKILESKQQIAEGKTIKVNLDEIWK